MMAAATLVRYDLAKMRHRQQLRSGRKQAKPKRRRYELPPPPGAFATAEKVRCDSPLPAPQSSAPERVAIETVGTKNSGCDSVTIPPAPALAANPAALEKTRQADAIRRKKWIPPWLEGKR
jgi:hypothetical protein